MKSRIKLDDSIKELLIGILAYEVVAQIIGLIIVLLFIENGSVLKYTVGLWIGAILAIASALHMWWCLVKNLSDNADREGSARAFAVGQNLLRYFVILAVFAGLCLTTFSYPLAAFAGIMGLKIGAYIQPIVSKLIKRSSK